LKQRGEMQSNKVVLKFKDHSLMKGNTADFMPNKKSFHLHCLNGEIKEIIIEDLKAIFFVKDFDGNKNHNYEYNELIPGAGRKINVKFLDGENLVGYTLGYSKERSGFFMTPADQKGNNKRIFVVGSATEKIEFK
jgi:hypothetical protein